MTEPTGSTYLDPESGRDIGAADLKALPVDEQKRIVKYWFQQYYEDPAENTPYESAEGGYIYIWGGPHNTDEVLYEEFGDVLPEPLIVNIAEELEEEHGITEWASIPGPEDFDQSFFASEFFPRFEESIDRIRRLLAYEVAEPDRAPFIALLYANIITALEAYLSDVFSSLVMKHRILLRKFVESDSTFKIQRTTASELFKLMEQMPARVQRHLYVLPFHRLEKVQKMYRTVLGIEFPAGLKAILDAVEIRHHIVHRNGLTKESVPIALSKNQVEDLLSGVETFVGAVDGEVRSLVWDLVKPADQTLPT